MQQETAISLVRHSRLTRVSPSSRETTNLSGPLRSSPDAFSNRLRMSIGGYEQSNGWM